MDGIFVPAEVLRCKALTPLERLLLSQLMYWDKATDGCFATNGTLAELLGTDPHRVSKLISDLRRKELIRIRFKGNWRHIHVIYDNAELPLAPFRRQIAQAASRWDDAY